MMDEEQKREDFASIEPNLNRVYDNNSKISPEFKELARKCFGRIFYMLGEKKFRRWIDIKRMNKQTKELIIKSMDEEELKNKPTTRGYFTRGTTEIKLNPKMNDSRKTNIHETFHMITDGGSKFCTFMDEGLTEYMAGLAWGKSESYPYNVNFIEFLHKEILGDSLIKSYLMGKDGFDNNLLNLINFDGKSNISDITEFYHALNVFHIKYTETINNKALKYNGTDLETIEKSNQKLKEITEKYELDKPRIMSMYQKIIVGKISEMSKNFDFYKDGNLDLESSNKAILNLLTKSNILDFINTEDTDKAKIEIENWIKETVELSQEQVLENSHMLVNYKGDERNRKKQEFLSKMMPTIEKNSNMITTNFPSDLNNDPLIMSENNNIPQKLFEKFLSDDMNITQYIETVARISQATGIKDIELEDYLDKYNIKFFGNTDNFKNINEKIISSIPKIQKLNEVEQQRKKDTVTSEYKSIGNNRFIEKRDNQIFFVELDDNGNFSEKEIKYSKELLFLKDKSKLSVDFTKGLPNLKVIINGEELELGPTLSLQDIKDMELTRTFSKDIRDHVSKNKYTTILNDEKNPWEIKGVNYSADIDKRTRQIDYGTYITDLKNIMPLIPEGQRDNFIKNITTNLLDKTYQIQTVKNGKIVRDEDTNKPYSAIISAISTLVKENEPQRKIEVANSELKSNSNILSKKRRNMVEKNSKTASIFFRNKEAELMYKHKEKQERKLKNTKYIKEATQNFKYANFYKAKGALPLEELPFQLPGVGRTQLTDTRNVEFSYNEFASAAKEMILHYPKDVRGKMFDAIFSVQMQRTYFVSGSDKKPPEISQALENVKTIIKENIFSDTIIEDEKIAPELACLNEFKVEKAKNGRKVAGICFKDEHSKKVFKSVSELVEFVKKSGVSNSVIQETTKELVNAELQRNNSEKDDSKINSEPE